MSAPYRSFWLVTLALLLVGAAPGEDVADLVRRGNAAFAREKFDEAVRLYEEAEERSIDPGLVAFNKAAALYRLGRFREAELCYRRCLEDGEAPGPRRARALYDLGTSLLHVKDGTDARALKTAIHCLQRCRHETTDDALRARAAYNLELARLLWVKAKANPSESNDSQEPKDDDKRRQQGEDDPQPEQGDAMQQKGRPIGKGPALLQDPTKGMQKAIETKETLAGKGNLGTLPDTDELQPLDAKDVAEHLERAARRILDERRQQLRAAPRDVPNVKDW
jgi:tetratricopeptide (TPR) repeat protein